MKLKLGFRGIMPLILGLASCGGYDSSSSDYRRPEEEIDSGTYRAVLATENGSVSSATGTAQVTISGDDFNVRVTVSDAPATSHIQHIHVGTRCPTAADDTNGDGLVDAAEATAVYGEPLITLDSDLETTSAETFPSGRSYNYNETASFIRILASLGASALGLEGKVINIHGASGSPELPIACGILRKVQDEG